LSIKVKKKLSDGIIIVFASKDDKVGIAVGVTDNLTEKYDAVKFVKVGSELLEAKVGVVEKILPKLVAKINLKLIKLLKNLKL
jgi:alanyl-tRNA synthetase